MTASFGDRLDVVIRATLARRDLVIRRAVAGLMRDLITGNPVGDPSTWRIGHEAPPGYVGGHSRSAWLHSYGVVDKSVPPPGHVDPAGQRTLDLAESGVRDAPAVGVHYLTNSVDYIEGLERGRSSQQPHGWIRQAAANFNWTVREASKR